jgi:hypothetical protein
MFRFSNDILPKSKGWSDEYGTLNPNIHSWFKQSQKKQVAKDLPHMQLQICSHTNLIGTL